MEVRGEALVMDKLLVGPSLREGAGSSSSSLSYPFSPTQKRLLNIIQSVTHSPSSHVIAGINRFFYNVMFLLIRSVHIWSSCMTRRRRRN
jgi:hypothetical protein